VREIEASTGESSHQALEAGLRNAQPCYALTDREDCPIALFGVTPDHDSGRANAGVIWLMGAELPRGCQMEFLRRCRGWLEHLQANYDVLWNRIDARNATHIRWLKWCGFKFDRLIAEHGVQRRAFWEFTRTRDAVHDS
jgi:hypothetical protein